MHVLLGTSTFFTFAGDAFEHVLRQLFEVIYRLGIFEVSSSFMFHGFLAVVCLSVAYESHDHLRDSEQEV